MSTEHGQSSTSVDRIVIQLSRIADALELLPGTNQDEAEPVSNEELAGLMRNKYRGRADEIIEIVKTHKYDKAIVDALKAAGIVSKSSYWADISFYRPIRDHFDG